MGILCLAKYVVCGQVGMSDSCLESNQELKCLKTHNDNNASEEKGADTELIQSTNLDKKVEQKGKPTPLQKAVFKMLNIIKELTLMILVVVTYAALSNNPPKISKSPAAFPFFPKDSLVTDYFKGELSYAKETSQGVDFSLIMFYAPWNADCKVVREEFEIVAKHFHKQIEISAVNCWQPGGECRRQYEQVPGWPVLIAYPTVGKGIMYKGPKLAPYIMKFVVGLIRPYIRITKAEEIAHLLATHDAVIVGSVNALPGSKDFAVLYSTTLRYLSQDPTQNVAFAIQTVPRTDENGNIIEPNLSLCMWNVTWMYPQDKPWTPDSLLDWITIQMHQITMWLVPPKTRSSTLAYSLESNPALLLFTPRNPMKRSMDYYNLLREIALEYNSCGNPRVKWLKESVHIKRLEDFYTQKILLQQCAIKKESEIISPITLLPKLKWINSSTVKIFKENEDSCTKRDNLKTNTPGSRSLSNEYVCDKEVNDAYSNLEDDFGKKLETSMLKDKYDHRSPRNLQKLWKRESCRLLRITQKILPSLYSDSIKNDDAGFNYTIEGMGCTTNRSLLLYALDSLESYHFAEKLGINLFERKDKTAAVIFNDHSETHYVLNKPVNDVTLREFIASYTQNSLPRSKKSITSIKSNVTYSYLTRTLCERGKNVCVKELDSFSFLPTIMQQDKAVVVMYHSKQCSFCSGISYKFLTLAKIFSTIKTIEFARIDGDLNILPWEYTMNVFPTVIYIPEKRKSESRIFPYNVPITIPNMLAFLLSNVNPKLKLQAMWVLCNQTQFEEERKSCISSIRAENLSLINETLKEWRNTNARHRAELMYRLQQLRNLHLLFAHSPQKTEEIEIYLQRLNSHSNGLKGNRRGSPARPANKSNDKDEL